MNQFDVYTIILDSAKSSEIKNTRPGVIISPTVMNKHLKTVIIAPLTHTIKNYPSRVSSSFAGQTGQIALDHIRSVDKSRLKKKIGSLDATTANNIKLVLATMFS